MFLIAKTSFITPMEYASQLYKNPRGIGCQYCHGKDGEGKIVATYVHKGVKKEFAGPAINHMQYSKFYNKLNKRNKGMPRYFLTKKEIKALYLYLHKDDEKEVQNAE
ncbi:MAG: cytochrome c [Epsilonproteobacteria bacterium]|nr:cytochrome c [Campylobacterota bacterium]